MTEIKTNTVLPQQKNVAVQNSSNYYTNPGYIPAEARTIKDEFVHQHKKNGLFERLYNQLKNLTGFGIGSKKAQDAVNKAETGEITEEEALKTIDKYRKSQANSEQAFGDVMSVGASGMTFFGLRNWLKKLGAEAAVNKNYYNNISDEFIRFDKKLFNKKLPFWESKTKAGMVAAFGAALVGGLVKWSMLKLNRIGSDEFKTNKKDFNGAKTPYDKALYKAQRKETNSKRRWANFRNFASGAINGLMMPITVLGGAIAGVPAYFAGNSLNRYFIGNHEEKEKSFDGYVENLKSDTVVHGAVLAATAVPMIKKARYTNIFDKNLTKAVNKLKDATLKKSDLQGRTVYQELDEIVHRNRSIQDIIYNEKLSIEERILKLTDENIFAVKMRQISGDGSPLTTALRENCPPSRTLEVAQRDILSALGDGYEVKQLLGVGTVAETYLAKDKSGKDVCIKILKKGITKEKVLADKDKFIKIVKESNKSKEEIKNLLRNVDDMSDGLLKELDLAQEMEAAKKLTEFTNVANVVKPIEVKNGVYVMEKATGISLSSLVELNSAYFLKESLEKFGKCNPRHGTKLYTKLKDVKDKDKQLEIITDYIKQIEARTPEYGDIKLTKEDFKALIEEYQHVFVEQFNKVGKDGKVMHADIHPGNIFIDVNALRNRKKNALSEVKTYLGHRDSNKIFTLIDTGNTVSMDKEQAMRAINLTSYIKHGNTQDIAEYMLYGVDGAALGGHTKEEATKILKDELSKFFFDTETRLSTVTNESLVEMASNIMRKYGMVPADTQLTLNKAKQSANNSLSELYESLFYFYGKEILDKGGSFMDMMSVAAKMVKDVGLMEAKYSKMKSVQENLNLKHLSLEQRLKHKNNPNMLKTNSEDYLTYHLKQKMKFNDKTSPIDIVE